jgi:hypothetical protein
MFLFKQITQMSRIPNQCETFTICQIMMHYLGYMIIVLMIFIK